MSSPLQSRIEKDYIEYYKAKDQSKIDSLRMLKSSMQNAEISNKAPLKDDDIIKIIKKEIKQRKDSSLEYQKGNRDDLSQKDLIDAAFFEQYLPAQMSSQELTTIVQEAVKTLGASTPADFGRVMGVVMPKVGNRADGREVSKLLQQILSK